MTDQTTRRTCASCIACNDPAYANGASCPNADQLRADLAPYADRLDRLSSDPLPADWTPDEHARPELDTDQGNCPNGHACQLHPLPGYRYCPEPGCGYVGAALLADGGEPREPDPYREPDNTEPAPEPIR